MKAFLQKHLGPNYVVKLFGFLTVGCVAVVSDPSLVSFFPDSWEPVVLGVARLVGVFAGAVTVNSVKGAKVTGGTVAASLEAEDRVAKEKALHEPVYEAEVVKDPIITLKDNE